MIFKFWLRGFSECECVSGLFVMCRVQTCLVSLSEIRDRLAWGRLALAQPRPQTGSGMSLQYSLPLCGLTTLCSEKVLTMRQTCYALSHSRWAAKATLMVASHLHLATSAALFFFFLKKSTNSVMCIKQERCGCLSSFWQPILTLEVTDVVTSWSVWAFLWILTLLDLSHNLSTSYVAPSSPSL